MKKQLISALFMVLLTMPNYAQEPVITEDCVINVSLFDEAVKNKQFDSAWEPWWAAYQSCPNVNRALYTRGEKIIKWKYDNASNAEEKETFRQLAINIYDDWIKYFGDNKKYPTDYIIGAKGVAYCIYYPEDPTPAYQWLKQSVVAREDKSSIDVLVWLFKVSFMQRALNETYSALFEEDYSLVQGILNTIASDDSSKQQKDAISALSEIEEQYTTAK